MNPSQGTSTQRNGSEQDSILHAETRNSSACIDLSPFSADHDTTTTLHLMASHLVATIARLAQTDNVAVRSAALKSGAYLVENIGSGSHTWIPTLLQISMEERFVSELQTAKLLSKADFESAPHHRVHLPDNVVTRLQRCGRLQSAAAASEANILHHSCVHHYGQMHSEDLHSVIVAYTRSIQHAAELVRISTFTGADSSTAQVAETNNIAQFPGRQVSENTNAMSIESKTTESSAKVWLKELSEELSTCLTFLGEDLFASTQKASSVVTLSMMAQQSSRRCKQSIACSVNQLKHWTRVV